MVLPDMIMVAILWGPSLDTILVVFPVLENVGARAFLEIAEDMIVLIPPNRCLDLEQVLKSKREVGRMGSMMTTLYGENLELKIIF